MKAGARLGGWLQTQNSDTNTSAYISVRVQTRNETGSHEKVRQIAMAVSKIRSSITKISSLFNTKSGNGDKQ